MSEEQPAVFFGDVSFRTMSPLTYYAASTECDRSCLAEALPSLQAQVIRSMTNARAELDPVPIVRCLDGPDGVCSLHAGFRLLGDVTAIPGTASVQQLAPLPCVCMLYHGNLAHVAEARALLADKAREAGLAPGREYREFHLYRETPESASNVLLLQLEVTAPDGGGPSMPPTPEFVFGPVRMHTLAGYRFLYVEAETDWAGMEATFEDLLDRLGACQRRLDILAEGPMRFSFRGPDAAGMYATEVGVPVAPGTDATEGARVRQVPATRVASIAFIGSYAGLTRGGELLATEVRERGLSSTGEYREFYLHYDGFDSPNTIAQVVYPLA